MGLSSMSTPRTSLRLACMISTTVWWLPPLLNEILIGPSSVPPSATHSSYSFFWLRGQHCFRLLADVGLEPGDAGA